MSEGEKHHISSYNSHIITLIALLILTIITVAVTSIELGPFTVTVALLIACVKVFIVLAFFMHLKFDRKIFKIMVGAVMLLFLAVVLLTFVDYAFRV